MKRHVFNQEHATLALLVTAALFLISGSAHAQLGTSNLGVPSSSLPGTTSSILLGALQLNPAGLSPPPFAAAPGLPSPTLGAAGNLGMGGIAGGGLSTGAGLSPMPTPGAPALAPSGTTPGLTFRNITNFGPGGMRSVPGSPSNAP